MVKYACDQLEAHTGHVIVIGGVMETDGRVFRIRAHLLISAPIGEFV